VAESNPYLHPHLRDTIIGHTKPAIKLSLKGGSKKTNGWRLSQNPIRPDAIDMKILYRISLVILGF
jgi:hypothetical protein